MHAWSYGASLSRHKLAGKPFNSKFQPFFSGSVLSFYNMTACLGNEKYAQDRITTHVLVREPERTQAFLCLLPVSALTKLEL